MKNMKNKWFSALPVLAVVFLSFALVVACGNKDDADITGSTDPGGTPPPGSVSVTFSNVTASGSPITTKLTLTFSQAVTDLSEADITLSIGATKGALTHINGGTYELTVTDITSAGEVTVGVSKSGYTFNPASKSIMVTFSNKRTVFFNTGADQTIAPITNLDPGATISKPSESSSLSKDGFTFDGKWYKDYSFDTATGLRTYSPGDEWNFDLDTVSQNMTLYAGRTGGVKIMPLTYIWSNQAGHLQGEVIQLTMGKTYKLGIRYILQPNFGPIQLQARRATGASIYSITLEPGSGGTFPRMTEGEFTATDGGGYFIGLSQLTSTNGGTYIVHEIWLKEVGGGDINLLTTGDFVWKDANSADLHFKKGTSEATDIGDPFWGPGGIRDTEWPYLTWNMNHHQVHFKTSWVDFVASNGKLSELTGGVIANNAHASLVFPKPAHP
jgi:hypothetical protein